MLTWLDRQWSRESIWLSGRCIRRVAGWSAFIPNILWPLYTYYKERNWELALPVNPHEGLIHFLEDNNLTMAMRSTGTPM